MVNCNIIIIFIQYFLFRNTYNDVCGFYKGNTITKEANSFYDIMSVMPSTFIFDTKGYEVKLII